MFGKGGGGGGAFNKGKTKQKDKQKSSRLGNCTFSACLTVSFLVFNSTMSIIYTFASGFELVFETDGVLFCCLFLLLLIYIFCSVISS